MSLKKDFLYNLLLTASQMLFPVITFPYASRILGAEGIGLTGFVESYCQYFILLAGLGLPVYGVREIAKVKVDPAAISALFIRLVTLHFLFTLAALIIYFLTFLLITDLRMNSDLFLLGSLLILMNVLSVEWLFQGLARFKYITLRTITIRLITLALLFILVRDRGDVNNYFLLLVFASVMTGILNIIYGFRIAGRPERFSLAGAGKHLKPLFLLASFLLAISLYTALNTILLGFFCGTEAVGYYTAAMKLIRIFLSVFSALNAVLIPRLAFSAASGNSEEYRAIISKSVRVVITFGLPIFFFIMVMSDNIIRVFAGDGFRDATLTLRILALLPLVTGLGQICGQQVLTPMSMDRQLLYSVIAGAIFSILLNISIVPVFAQNGTAAVTIFTEIFVTILLFMYASRTGMIRLRLAEIGKQFIIQIPLALTLVATIFFIGNKYLQLGVAVVIFILGFLGIQWALRDQLIMEILQWGRLFIKSKTIRP